MIKRVTIPTANGELCEHFGHCQRFYFANIEDGKIVSEESLLPPEHKPGAYPTWIKEQGASAVIASGIGSKAKDLLVQESIPIYNGGTERDPRKLVEALLANQLKRHDDDCKKEQQQGGF